MGSRRSGPGLGDRVHALTVNNPLVWCALVLLAGSCLADLTACPLECHCPKSQLCSAGVPLVLDNCGCCRVCARRFNEDCNALRPCDQARGLRCQLEATTNATHGICRASTLGRPCIVNGKVYQHSEIFQQTCRLQCSCKDGRVACSPLCPSFLSVPSTACAGGRFVKVPGTCCQKWKCASTYSKHKPPRISKWKEMVVPASQEAKHWKALHKMRGQFKSQNSGDSGCRIKNTAWSTCSQTCGMGISTRQSTNNIWCQSKQESRLCQLRPCRVLNDVQLREGQKCLKTEKEKEPRPFVYRGCTSLRKYTPKYCGFCTDGRCCQPSQTRTTKVRFRCGGMATVVKDVMKIKRCDCSRRCQQHGAPYWPNDGVHDGSADRERGPKEAEEIEHNF
uniref:CCN family member 1-like n=1 Tax=Pristiophorus japonicus TaxID=55135 RepID=UPI00398F182B